MNGSSRLRPDALIGSPVLVLIACVLCIVSVSGAGPASIPFIYSTDLFHPHSDPDDHFDLATIFALPELDIRAVILDQGQDQIAKPGRIPLRQLMTLTGRNVRFATGLGEKLKNPSDTAVDQATDAQGGVQLLLETLRVAAKPVRVVATGSMRDVCAAFNREPALCRKQIERLYIIIGNADDGGREWNVDLDPQSYAGILRSGLLIYWSPCLPMGGSKSNSLYSCFWKFRQADVLEQAPRQIQNFFIYALQRVDPAELDPLKALGANLRPWRHLVWSMDRNMWCTAPLLHAADREVVRVDGRFVSRPVVPGRPPSDAVFAFIPAHVEVDGTGTTRKRLALPNEANVQMFAVKDPQTYPEAMKQCLGELLRSLK